MRGGAWLAAASLVLGVCVACAHGDDRPNILVIITDDMGYADLGCYGSQEIATPNIDALAESGVRCTQGYVTGVVCAPTRAGFLTGKYQQRFGFEHNLTGRPAHVVPEHYGLPLEEATLGERLGGAGYATALVGKWHVGHEVDAQHPNRRGFDHFAGLVRGWHTYWVGGEGDHRIERNGRRVTEFSSGYLTDWFTDEAVRVLGGWESGGDERPWFLVLAYTTPHGPMEARPDDLERYAHIEDETRRAYCAMQHRLDVSVGRIIAELDRLDERGDTLVVFFNDNGGAVFRNGSSNAPFRGFKSLLFEGGVRVPFIFSWPGELPAGVVYDGVFAQIDLAGTFLAAGGVPRGAVGVGAGMDSVNLLPFLRRQGASASPRATVYWRIATYSAAIREGDWKLIRVPWKPAMLFDLATDPGESDDVASDHPEVVRALLGKLAAWEAEMSPPMWVGSNEALAEHRARFEAAERMTPGDRAVTIGEGGGGGGAKRGSR